MQNRDTKNNNKNKNKKKKNEGHFLTHCALRMSNKDTCKYKKINASREGRRELPKN